MKVINRILTPATWVLYLVIVCEILFMISPFALYFYSAYGPTLNFLHHSPYTAWLTQFFLPHFSETSSPLLNALPRLGGFLIVIGVLMFFAGAIPIYWAKFRRRGAVTGGLYKFIRHPQYVGLAIVGLGTVLVWPRFLVLITYVIMIFLYDLLARFEEEQCLTKFGETYLAYQTRTGMYLPRALSTSIPRILPTFGTKRVLATIGIYIVLILATVLLAFSLRDYSLSKVSSFYTDDLAVLSPANLTEKELMAAFQIAMSDRDVQKVLKSNDGAKLIVYVIPQEWYLPDLPIDSEYKPGGHHVPQDFDRRYYKLLFTKPRTREPEVAARNIVKSAYGRDPIVLVKVDILSSKLIGIETPPPHVYWGDIPTPMF
ncbi:MAG: methyltransferase family protein [Thermodesulfobacteriota bacterium]